ncbi:MAG: TraR/DksA family transcriptional regulator [bacterium]
MKSAKIRKAAASSKGGKKARPAKGRAVAKKPSAKPIRITKEAVKEAAPVAQVAPPPVPEPPRPKPPKMKERELKRLREELEKERDRLMNEISSLDEMTLRYSQEQGNATVPGYSTHIAEHATDSQVLETALIQRSMEEQRLGQVLDALERLKAGDYGICQECGRAIGIERLLAKPHAVMCVECRRHFESAGR